MAITLRKPKKSDAIGIAAISIEVWLGTYLKRGVNAFFANYALEVLTPSKIEKLIFDPDQFILVSDNQKGIDGFIRVSSASKGPVDGCSELEIATFYVQPRHQGKGVGRRLMEAAFQHRRNNAAKSVWLATNAENGPAIAFYLARGFEQVGETSFRIDGESNLNNVYSYSLS